jgi:hypothetical protein
LVLGIVEREIDQSIVDKINRLSLGQQSAVLVAKLFKPAGGHGSKAVYRGDKVTKGVWAEIVRGGYVAQEFAAPGERMIKLDGMPERRKTDVRRSWPSASGI